MSKYNPETDNWSVYIHTVPKEVTGYEYDKYYVGITKVTPNERWQNGYGYKSQIFYKAIEKYGWSNMKHEVIACNLSAEDAVSLEKFLILVYDSLNGHHGYNVTTGGDGFNGYEMADSTVEKLRDISKKKWEDNEYVERVKKGLPRGEDHFKSRSVVLLNTREVFTTETEAQMKYGLSSPTQFIRLCNGKTNCEKKDEQGRCLTWAWYEDYIQMTEEQINERIIQSTRYLNKSPLKRQIVCLNTGKIYDYAFKIMEDSGLNNIDNVIKCCRHNALFSGKSVNGDKLVWRYLDEYENMSKEEIQGSIEYANSFTAKKNLISVLDKTTGIVYSSIKECARNVGIPQELIKNAISGIDYYMQKSPYKDRFEKVKKGE